MSRIFLTTYCIGTWYGAVIVKQPKRNKYDFVPRAYTRGIYKRPKYGWSKIPSTHGGKFEEDERRLDNLDNN